MFNLFKKEEKKEEDLFAVHNRLLDIRVGRKYARGNSMDGNTYECFKNTAEVAYEKFIESSDTMKNINKEDFIEGYNSQTEELALVLK